MKNIDIIIPCYNESQVIDRFYEELSKITSQLNTYSFNYIFIDDGSSDDTLTKVQNLCYVNEYIKFISFSRNFGKESAIYAGLKESTGDFVVVMDADLQDPPILLLELISAVDKGECDICATRRVTRKGEPPIRSFFARQFYKLMNKISDVELIDGARDYRIMTRQVVNAVLDLSEVQRFSKGIFSWVGFKTKWIEYENVKRIAGETKWSFWKLFKYAFEGITAFSVVPLRIASLVGTIISFVAFMFLMYIFIKTLISGTNVPGYASTITIILFIGGIIIMALGILGEYISKIYLEVKRRPIFIVSKTNIRDSVNNNNT